MSTTEVDWATAKGIADEATFNRFVESVGGQCISSILRKPIFENADYLFSAEKVILELKVLETEFSDTDQFKHKLTCLIEKHVREHGMRGPLLGQPWPKEFIFDFIRLFRPPLGRIAKKANRQIRETKTSLGLTDHSGVLLCVNDSFRNLEPDLIFSLFGSILANANSSVTAMIYLTNHYVDIPGDDYARFLWCPIYSESAPPSLVEFVNWLGRKWFDFCEGEIGPFDSRIETPDGSFLRDARAIKKPDRF